MQFLSLQLLMIDNDDDDDDDDRDWVSEVCRLVEQNQAGLFYVGNKMFWTFASRTFDNIYHALKRSQSFGPDMMVVIIEMKYKDEVTWQFIWNPNIAQVGGVLVLWRVWKW